MRINENLPTIKIQAQNIWIRTGDFIVGNSISPYQNLLDIELTGTRNGDYLKIDDISDAGTKTLAVTSNL